MAFAVRHMQFGADIRHFLSLLDSAMKVWSGWFLNATLWFVGRFMHVMVVLRGADFCP